MNGDLYVCVELFRDSIRLRFTAVTRGFAWHTRRLRVQSLVALLVRVTSSRLISVFVSRMASRALRKLATAGPRSSVRAFSTALAARDDKFLKYANPVAEPYNIRVPQPETKVLLLKSILIRLSMDSLAFCNSLMSELA